MGQQASGTSLRKVKAATSLRHSSWHAELRPAGWTRGPEVRKQILLGHALRSWPAGYASMGFSHAACLMGPSATVTPVRAAPDRKNIAALTPAPSGNLSSAPGSGSGGLARRAAPGEGSWWRLQGALAAGRPCVSRRPAEPTHSSREALGDSRGQQAGWPTS